MIAVQPNPELRRQQIEADLPYLHKERWNRITRDLRDQIEQAPPAERDAIEEQLRQHYTTRFHPETSRAALLAEAGITEGE